ncbi:hypothetical protein SDJN02_07160, partial [Cucurbita argyrosperma subsp. argyrosperma]
MEFDSNFKDDLPLLSSFFSDKPESKRKLNDDNNDDDTGEFSAMELATSPSSSKGLFHNLQLHNFNRDREHDHDHNHNHNRYHQYLHHFPINGSDSSSHHELDRHQFSIDGSLQTLLSGMPTQTFDPNFQPFGNEFSKDHTFENGAKFMHGLLGSRAVWTNFPGNFVPQFSQPPNSSSSSSTHLGLGPATVGRWFLDEISYNTDNGYDQNKKKKRIQSRKENRPLRTADMASVSIRISETS